MRGHLERTNSQTMRRDTRMIFFFLMVRNLLGYYPYPSPHPQPLPREVPSDQMGHWQDTRIELLLLYVFKFIVPGCNIKPGKKYKANNWQGTLSVQNNTFCFFHLIKIIILSDITITNYLPLKMPSFSHHQFSSNNFSIENATIIFDNH